jgi:hypothetical protein
MDIGGHVPLLLEGNGIGDLLAFSLEAESLG